MSIKTNEIIDATGLDVVINGTTVLAVTEAGVTRTGADYSWSQEILGDNFAIAGGGAVAQAVLSIGAYRKYNVWEFPNGATDPYIDVNFWLPPGYDGSGLSMKLYWVKTATATGSNIVTNARLACIGAGDSLDATVSTGINVTTAVGTNNYLFVTTHSVTPANAADGGLCHGLIQRLVTNGSDDYTGSTYLLGARVEYA
jgi:hypothetical protein